jgi:uncharacterized protein
MADVEKPMPRVSTVNAPYFQAAAEGRFELQRCSYCGEHIYYPRVACPHCLATDGLVWTQVSGRGTVYSFALIHRPQHPALFEEVPIAFAAIQLKEGPLVLANVVNCPCENLRIGMSVRVITVKVTSQIGLPKFEPAEDISA